MYHLRCLLPMFSPAWLLLDVSPSLRVLCCSLFTGGDVDYSNQRAISPAFRAGCNIAAGNARLPKSLCSLYKESQRSRRRRFEDLCRLTGA